MAFTWRRADPADGTCDDFRVVGGNMDSNLEQPVSTSVLNVTVSETDIGVLRFCCQASIAGASGTSNSVLSIDVVGEFVFILFGSISDLSIRMIRSQRKCICVLLNLLLAMTCSGQKKHAHFLYKVSAIIFIW